MPLEEEADLYTLLDELRPVIFDWRDLGLGLGVAGYVLDTYKSKEPKDAMMDMLTHALRNLELKWIKIVRVLMKINPNLAKNLRSRYCPNEQIEENVDGEYNHVGKIFATLVTNNFWANNVLLVQALRNQKSVKHNFSSIQCQAPSTDKP